MVPSTKPRTELHGDRLYLVLHFPALRHSHKEKEQEAFLDGDGESLASRNLSYQLQEYMKLPLDSPYSEKWEGMGELLDGTCNSENDMQRGYWGDSQRNNDPFEQMNQWAAPIQGR